MTAKELKKKFRMILGPLYPNNEIDSMYYWVVQHRLHLNRVNLALDPNLDISDKDEVYFNMAIEKLQNEIPIQYITGETEFFGLPFVVDHHVLIPRPETEELVSWVIDSYKKRSANSKLKILDIGTGSGCIGISLKKNIPNADVWILDISKEALAVASKNADLNRVKIHNIRMDILKMEPLPTTFDIIISNPPYIRELEKNSIKNNVLRNEPSIALFVKDNNPLIFYDKIADIAKNYLEDKGGLFFEINQYLGKETLALLEKKGFKNNELRRDIFGNDRMIFSSFTS